MKTIAMLLGFLATAIAMCQAPTPTVSVSAPPKQVAAGGKLTLVVTVTFAPGYHGYQNPPASDYEIPVTVKIDGKEFKVTKVAYPAGIDATVGGSDKPTKAYEGSVKIPVTLTAPVKVGAKSLKILVGFQQCDATTCFPPGEISSTVKINVVKKVAKG